MDAAATREVARLLLLHWDPLLVADIDVDVGAEYVWEAGALLEMLAAGATDDDIAARLTDYARDLSRFPDHAVTSVLPERSPPGTARNTNDATARSRRAPGEHAAS